MIFGSRNGMSLCGHCVRQKKFASTKQYEQADVSSTWRRDTEMQDCPADVATRSILSDAPSGIENLSPLDLLSRIPTASLGEPSDEGSAPLVYRISMLKILNFSA